MRLFHGDVVGELLERAEAEAEEAAATRIAELEKDLADAQEQLQELAPMRPVLEQLRLIAFGTPDAPSVDTPKVLALNGLTLWGAGSGAELLLLRLLWSVRDMADQRKA